MSDQSGDWLDDIDGIKDVIDGTGETLVTLPRFSKLIVEGSGAQIEPDPVKGAYVLRILQQGGGLTFTVEHLGDYSAAYGEHVVMGSDDGIRVVTLPPAAGRLNGQIGVLNTAAALVDVMPTGDDTINGNNGAWPINSAGDSIILQSDGVSAWWIVARSTS